MNKYMIILLTALSLTLISGQASAFRDCHSWWKNGVKYTNCYKSGYRYYDHGHRNHHGYHHGSHKHHGHHGHHHHGHHHGHHR